MTATAIALVMLACTAVLRPAAAASAPRGTTVHFSAALNALLIKYPGGRSSKVVLAPTTPQPPAIKVGKGPAKDLRRTYVLPGTASADGSLSFNPANANSPADTTPSNDKPRVIVTDLKGAKVVASVSVPEPGIKGCNFFAAKVVANGGRVDDYSYDGRYVAAGKATGGSVPLWLVLKCPKASYLANYSYNVKTKKLAYSKVKWALTSEFLGVFAPNTFIYGSSKVPGASGLYAIASRYSTGQVAVFQLRGAAWVRVALIDAGVSSDSPCRGFVFTNVPKHQLAAICGPELAELAQLGGYKGIAHSEFLYWSSLAALPGSSGSVRARVIGINVAIDASSASAHQFSLLASRPATEQLKYNLPSAKYASNVIVVDY